MMMIHIANVKYSNVIGEITYSGSLEFTADNINGLEEFIKSFNEINSSLYSRYSLNFNLNKPFEDKVFGKKSFTSNTTSCFSSCFVRTIFASSLLQEKITRPKNNPITIFKKSNFFIIHFIKLIIDFS